MHTLETLTPIFAVIGLGYGLTRKGFLGKGFLDELNWLVYWVCLPALMVASLDRARGLLGEALPVMGIFFTATILVMGLALLTARGLGLKRWQWGTFVQGAFRGNLGFIGVPTLIFAVRGMEPGAANTIIAQGVFIFAPTMILYNVASVAFLVGGREGASLQSLPKTLSNVARNPLIIAAVIGLVLYLAPVDLPTAAGNSLQFIGRMAAPAALICVGGGMALTDMEGRYRSASFCASLKVFVTPALAWILSLPFGLSDGGMLILMIYSCAPTAVASYIMAKQLHGDGAMASGTIVISTLLSVLSLSFAVTFF